MKPLIGINLDISTGPPCKIWIYATYVDAIIAAGGIPILVPPLTDKDLSELLGRLGGIVLIGGDDYSPSLYGEDRTANVELIDPKREEFDLRLINQLIERPGMPVLGICNGLQLMNIALGGSLVQDIVTQMPNVKVKHRGEEGWKVKDWHEVEIEPGSRLSSIYKKHRFAVPTAHHQGIKVVGKGLTIAARTDDGMIEALEMRDRPFAIGVMWHPERDFTANEPLFKELIMHTSRVNRISTSF